MTKGGSLSVTTLVKLIQRYRFGPAKPQDLRLDLARKSIPIPWGFFVERLLVRMDSRYQRITHAG